MSNWNGFLSDQVCPSVSSVLSSPVWAAVSSSLSSEAALVVGVRQDCLFYWLQKMKDLRMEIRELMGCVIWPFQKRKLLIIAMLWFPLVQSRCGVLPELVFLVERGRGVGRVCVPLDVRYRGGRGGRRVCCERPWSSSLTTLSSELVRTFGCMDTKFHYCHVDYLNAL